MTEKPFSSPIFMIFCCFLMVSSIIVQPARVIGRAPSNSYGSKIPVKPSPSGPAPGAIGTSPSPAGHSLVYRALKPLPVCSKTIYANCIPASGTRPCDSSTRCQRHIP